MNKIKNIFKIGVKTETVDNNFIKVAFMGKNQKVRVLNPYGIQSNSPNKSIVGLLADQANEESLLAVVFPVAELEDLDESEICLGVPGEDAKIFFRNDGKIYLRAGNEGGDFMVRFNELKSGFDELVDNHNNLVTAYNLHIHTTTATIGETAVVGVIAPTTSSETSSTASVDDAKIEDIEVPEL